MNPKSYGGIDVAKKSIVIGIYGQEQDQDRGEHRKRSRQSR